MMFKLNFVQQHWKMHILVVVVAVWDPCCVCAPQMYFSGTKLHCVHFRRQWQVVDDEPGGDEEKPQTGDHNVLTSDLRVGFHQEGGKPQQAITTLP